MVLMQQQQYDDDEDVTFADLESFLLQEDVSFGGGSSKAINMSHKINTGYFFFRI